MKFGPGQKPDAASSSPEAWLQALKALARLAHSISFPLALWIAGAMLPLYLGETTLRRALLT